MVKYSALAALPMLIGTQALVIFFLACVCVMCVVAISATYFAEKRPARRKATKRATAKRRTERKRATSNPRARQAAETKKALPAYVHQKMPEPGKLLTF